MPHYKLTYFDYFGRAEPLRQIFVAAGKEFDDVRVNATEWAELKPKTTFGNLPTLEVDGKMIVQSYAIGRYLARQFGLSGRSPYEEAVADSIIAQFNDLVNDVYEYKRVENGYAQGDKAKMKEEIYIPGIRKHLPYFANFLKKNKSGFLVGDSLTWADIVLAHGVSLIDKNDPELMDEFPEVKTHYKMIHNLPRLKEYLAKRSDKVKWTNE